MFRLIGVQQAAMVPTRMYQSSCKTSQDMRCCTVWRASILLPISVSRISWTEIKVHVLVMSEQSHVFFSNSVDLTRPSWQHGVFQKSFLACKHMFAVLIAPSTRGFSPSKIHTVCISLEDIGDVVRERDEWTQRRKGERDREKERASGTQHSVVHSAGGTTPSDEAAF